MISGTPVEGGWNWASAIRSAELAASMEAKKWISIKKWSTRWEPRLKGQEVDREAAKSMIEMAAEGRASIIPSGAE